MALQKLAHVEVLIDDVEKALEFHTGVLGLVEVAREDGTVYLGCGADENYDIALTDGGTGVVHFAFEVSEEELGEWAKRLSDAGVEVEERRDGEPGQARALRFSTPSGHAMELAVLEKTENYLHPGAPKRTRLKGAAPLDLDHLTLRAQDVKGLVEFLQGTLDFHVSDVFQPAPEVWGAAWTRVGEYHHDLAVIGTPSPQETLDHVAWAMES